MGTLTIPSHSTYHGPDTVGHLEMFSVDNIIAEFRQNCPDILALLQCLGNSSEDDDSSKQAKIITFVHTYEMLLQGVGCTAYD